MNIGERTKAALLVIAGVVCGLGGLFMYLLRAHTYFIGDNPSACVNCHIMTPYYATWSNGATCNDCHVPHQNLAVYYGFKAVDGLKHTAYFVGRMEHQAIKAETLTGQVVMDNCIRCHEQLNTEFVKTGRMGYMTQQAQGGKVCWDCHRNVPHGGMNSLMATGKAIETMARLASVWRLNGSGLYPGTARFVADGAQSRGGQCV